METFLLARVTVITQFLGRRVTAQGHTDWLNFRNDAALFHLMVHDVRSCFVSRPPSLCYD